ncbi:hypothetical protein RYH74_22455 [Pseudomonas sp. LSJ-87]|uniref:hypothetical protein n=1 Tax=Pseudomonas sp. LSJ-87 TaxID=3079932 RepID=UPI00294179F8|nr:hypothetical protein [Pseudomonas sp. LSJ-87]MDV5100037.1 hypothetical protein [Pseudomonas sp. LSJ-87]
MTALEQQIKTLRNEYLLGQSAGQSRESIEDCKHIYERFHNVASSLKAMAANTAVLRALPADAPEFMQLSSELQEQCSKAIGSLNEFIGVWSQKKSAARQDDALDNAQVALEKLTTQLEEKVLSCWKAWTSKLDSLSRVEQVMLDTQRGIPGVDKFYTEYVALRKKFLAEAKQIPETVWNIQELNKLAVRMQELRDQMNFDLPADVGLFFNQLNQPGSLGQVPLSIMTWEAFQWLQEHDLLGKFTVSRKAF